MRTIVTVLILLGIVAATATGILVSYHGNVVGNDSSESSTSHGTTSMSSTIIEKSTSTISEMSSATSAQHSQSTTGAMLAAIPEPINTAQDLFGNFSQLTLKFSVTNGSTTTNATFSFSVTGHPTINGTKLTEVNYQISSGDNSTAATIYYDSNYTSVIVSVDGQNLTGLGGMVGESFLVAFTGIFPTIETQFGINSTLLSNFQVQGTKSESFGNLNMEVTTYSATNLDYSRLTIKNAKISIGYLSGTNLSMMTYLHSDAIENGSEYQATFGLVNATIA